LIEDCVLECPLDDGNKRKWKKKVVPSIRAGFVVHINKDGAIIKVNGSKSKLAKV